MSYAAREYDLPYDSAYGSSSMHDDRPGYTSQTQQQSLPSQHFQPPAPSYAKQHQRGGYNSSGELDQYLIAPLVRPAVSSANSASRVQRANPGPSQLSQSQGSGNSASSRHQLREHRKAQASDEFDSFGNAVGGYRVGNSGVNQSYINGNNDTLSMSSSPDRGDNDVDSSFDFLLSPGLAPVGPISTSNTANTNAPPLALSSQPLSPAGGLAPGFNPAEARAGGHLRVNVARPAISRSQTAGPIPTPNASSARYVGPGSLFARQQMQPQQSFGAPQQQQQPAPTVPAQPNEAGSRSSVYGSQLAVPTAAYPQPPVSSAELIKTVMNMRNGRHAIADATQAPPMNGLPVSTTMLSSLSSPMTRSHSANAAVRVQQQSTHTRNTSNGSTGSNDEPNGPLTQQGVPRTASGRNVTTPAAKAESGVETVILSHHKIAEIPSEVIDVLVGSVERLALSYNYLTNLPADFTRLGGTIRYLNIRLNMFTHFPAVLCEMPSLEILDISRNKIKRLPPACGTLKNLRVFSISKNRVRRLPTYFADMTNLRVLKIDHNPLEWPTREIASGPPTVATLQDGESSVKFNEAQAMQKWLTELRDWIRKHSSDAPSNPHPPLVSSRSDEIVPSASDRTPRHRDVDRHAPGIPSVIKLATATPSQESRLWSPGSTASLTSQKSIASLTSQSSDPASVITSSVQSEDIVQPALPAPKQTQEFEPLQSPEAPGSPDSSRNSQQHGRNASHSLAQQQAKRGIRPKKSLPDLRQNHDQILDERLNDVDAIDSPSSQEPSSGSLSGSFRHQKSSSGSSIARVPTAVRSPILSPIAAQTQDEDESTASSFKKMTLSEESDHIAPIRDISSGRARRSPNAVLNAPPNALDRGSGAYFRRLSMLPAFTISKAVPSTLLDFIDAIRGILFSLSQIYTSFKQCIVFPAADRLPVQLTRAMASSDDAMGFLIDALDRFDASSRRKAPDISVVKDVVETCRENVITFGKLVNVLVVHMNLLFGQQADIRYTRTIILGLYGAMGEIANSWAALTPLKDDIAIWLRGNKTDSPYPQDTQSALSQSTKGSPAVNADHGISPALNKQRAGNPSGAGVARRNAGAFTKYNVL